MWMPILRIQEKNLNWFEYAERLFKNLVFDSITPSVPVKLLINKPQNR